MKEQSFFVKFEEEEKSVIGMLKTLKKDALMVSSVPLTLFKAFFIESTTSRGRFHAPNQTSSNCAFEKSG